VTLGNIVSGAVFTGLALYYTYPVKRPEVVVEPAGTDVEAVFG
jgi:hypothetical protein